VTKQQRLATKLMAGAGLIMGVCLGWLAIHVYGVWQVLPPIDVLDRYKPALPLRIYSTDGQLLAEYGEERREIVAMSRIPVLVRQSLLAIEDARYYEHGAVDYPGLLRAVWINAVMRRHAQGGSTITMQVARQFFLSAEKTYDRKLREILLAYKLEQTYSKDRLLELYMNQIYLGERAYGFSAAASIYFGKTLEQLSAAEAAMLAGLPKAPSAYNPVVNPERAQVRQRYILQRMRELGHLNEAQYQQALAEPLQVKSFRPAADPAFAYPVERVRQILVAQYGEQAYREGLDVTITLSEPAQRAAYQAVREGLLRTQMRKPYTADVRVATDMKNVDQILGKDADRYGLLAAVVTRIDAKAVTVRARNGSIQHLKPVARAIRPLVVGSLVHIGQVDGQWQIVQVPEMEGALVSIDANSGDIVALVGGFDFERSKFDHALQAYRQPGSCFKPFVYSAALEKGYFPGTLVNDAQRELNAQETGARPWSPRNYGNRYDGFITARQGLVRSKNLVTVGLMQAAGAEYVQQFALRFGFEAERNPGNLPLALGAGAVTPMQLTQAYATFANGGYLVQPRLIQRIVRRKGDVLYQNESHPQRERVLSARNAYVMDSLLRDVVLHGTGRAAISLGKSDVAGKTGTSNQANDAWFAGYATGIATTVWLGYDQARSLGAVTGATLALPIWTQYMGKIVADRPPVQQLMPEDLSLYEGDFIYPEYQTRACLADNYPFIRSAWKCDANPRRDVPLQEDAAEHDRILQWFRQGD
jgi:penicillin-binding protein 1A